MSTQKDISELLGVVDGLNKQVTKLNDELEKSKKQLKKYKTLYKDTCRLLAQFDLDCPRRDQHLTGSEWEAWLNENWKEEQEGKRLSKIAHKKELLKKKKGKK